MGNLKTAWTFTTTGDVSATAIVVKGVAYFPDWGGKLWALDTKTGKALWSHDVSDYTGTAGSASRTSPAYWNGELVIGTGNLMTAGLGPAFEIGINARTGAMLWRTKADPNLATIVTGSATIDNGIVYTGVSSKTEHTTVTPTFRGSVEALDARTGKILWKTYMVPAGFNGAAVWSSQPVVDHKTGMLYVTTGNSYSVPKGYCVNPGQTDCKRLPLDAYIDSIVALRLTTGKIVWAHHTLTADTWTMADPNASPDFDFGADPNLFTTTINGKRIDVLGAGQKSGMYYALDPATGKEIWATQAGPGGVLGGIEWGTSTDGKRIYAAITNGSHKAYTYTTFDGQKKTTSGGLWTALDPATGKILWQTADPQGSRYITDGFVSSAKWRSVRRLVGREFLRHGREDRSDQVDLSQRRSRMVGCGNCGWRGLLGQRIRHSGTQAALQRQQQQVLRVLAERPLTRAADDGDLSIATTACASRASSAWTATGIESGPEDVYGASASARALLEVQQVPLPQQALAKRAGAARRTTCAEFC